MAKKIYWMATPDGGKTQIEGADARDAQAAAGWTECGEPAGTDLVWARNDTHGGWAKFPARVLRVWQSRGWTPGAPPQDVVDPGAALMAVPAVSTRPAEEQLALTDDTPEQ